MLKTKYTTMPAHKKDIVKRVRKPITTPEVHMLELYRFRLVEFVNSKEFFDITSAQQDKILRELTYMDISIPIIIDLFAVTVKKRAVVAWKKKFERNTPFYWFSSPVVLAQALEISESNVYRCLNGKRLSAGGYSIMYEDKFDKQQEQ